MNRLRQPNKMLRITLLPIATLALNACGTSHDKAYSADVKEILASAGIQNHYEMTIADSTSNPQEVTLTINRTSIGYGESKNNDSASAAIDIGCEDGQLITHNLINRPSDNGPVDKLQISQELFKIAKSSDDLCIDGLIGTDEVLLPLTGDTVRD